MKRKQLERHRGNQKKRERKRQDEVGRVKRESAEVVNEPHSKKKKNSWKSNVKPLSESAKQHQKVVTTFSICARRRVLFSFFSLLFFFFSHKHT